MMSRSKMLSRPMNEFEKLSINPFTRFYIQFAIEVDNPQYLSLTLNKIKNALAGLYIKTDGDNLIINHQDPNSVVVHQIPKSKKTLKECCDWIYNTFTPSVNYSLASIAADDKRIVVNSSHAVTDGGFYVNLLKNLQDPSKSKYYDNVSPMPRDLRSDVLKKDFDEFLRNESRFIGNWPAYSSCDLTYFNLQEHVTLPDKSKDTTYCYSKELNSNELSPFIYDKKTNTINHMSEYEWTGLCLSINAKNGKFGPIGLSSCMDFRRITHHEKELCYIGNAFTNFVLAVKNVNSKMTIGEVCSDFRNTFNLLKKNDWFYKEYLFPVDNVREDCCLPNLSNVGPMKYKKPINDFYLQVSSKDEGMRPHIGITSYAKINEDTGMNKLIFHMHCAQSKVTLINGRDIFETFIHFLKTANPSQTIGSTLDELINFQKSIK